MPDFEALLNQSRNVLLNPQRSRRDVIRAGIQATGGIPYAEAIGDIEAQKFDRALRGYRVATAERDYEARQDQVMWERAQKVAERGDENAKRLLELAGAYGTTDADAQRLAAAVIARTEADDINDASALPGLVAEEAQKLGLQARPDLTIMSGPQGSIYSIDPTGAATEVVAGKTTPTPRTDEGKISADLTAGLISPAQAMRAQRELYTDTGETWRPVTEEERTQYGIPEGQGAQISTTGKVQTIGRGGGISIYDPQTGNIIAQVGGTPLTESQLGKQGIEISDAIRESNARLSELDSAIRSLRETPEAVGVSGRVIESVGGYLQQVTDLVGIDGEWLPTIEVQRTRTELASLLGQYIPTITGDESGRYSDQDMLRAQAALPATNARAGFPVVESALLTLRDVEQRSLMRRRMRADGFDPSIDITYPDGQYAYAQQLMNEGKTLEEAADVIVQLFARYGVSPEVVGIQ